MYKFRRLDVFVRSWPVASGPKFDANLALLKSCWQASFMARELFFSSLPTRKLTLRNHFFAFIIIRHNVLLPHSFLLVFCVCLFRFFLKKEKRFVCVLYSFTVSVHEQGAGLSGDDRISSVLCLSGCLVFYVQFVRNEWTPLHFIYFKSQPAVVLWWRLCKLD